MDIEIKVRAPYLAVFACGFYICRQISLKMWRSAGSQVGRIQVSGFTDMSIGTLRYTKCPGRKDSLARRDDCRLRILDQDYSADVK